MAEIVAAEPGLNEAVKLAEQAESAAQIKLKETKQEVDSLRAHLFETEQSLKAARENAHEAQGRLDELAQSIQRDKARYQAMDELSKAHEGFFQPVRQALKFAEGNPRVHGAVAHLIDVPKELETAMEMVLGGSLQNIVTQDEETAQELINYLRQNRFGRTTFLPISAVNGRSLSAQERNVLNLPGCLGVASELTSKKRSIRALSRLFWGVPLSRGIWTRPLLFHAPGANPSMW